MLAACSKRSQLTSAPRYLRTSPISAKAMIEATTHDTVGIDSTNTNIVERECNEKDERDIIDKHIDI
jgi:hypothetical protein